MHLFLHEMPLVRKKEKTKEGARPSICEQRIPRPERENNEHEEA